MRAYSSLVAFWFFSASCAFAQPSHLPLRQAPPPSQRPLGKGPALFVDPARGKDDNDGSAAKPLQSLRQALTHLKAGDTLYLRGGTYYERAYLALHGKADAPITIRAYPGEIAILDGGLREFFETPEQAWEPFPGGGKGEYRSTKRYPNLRHVLGSFGDSMIGLQSYYHPQDLRADNELVDWLDWADTAKSDLKPLYLGPGLWYDPHTGHVHARLAPTNLPKPIPNYRGPTDPRKLPMVLAPFHAVPLHIDGARHVRLQDLVVRGAGYIAVRLEHAYDLEMDNVTIWAGAYGIRASETVQFRLLNSGIHGNVAPWTFRSDGSKRDYPGRPHRNLSRLNTHALLDIDAGRESSVYATPQNDRWEIAHCDFTDAHDGPYLGAINVKFHHNLVENLQDDGVYLSPMYLRHRLDKTDPQIHIYQNVFRGLLTSLAFGGSETSTHDQVYVYRNVFDHRVPVQTGRPSVKKLEPGLSTGKLIGDHGSPPWPALAFYHNTCLLGEPARDAAMATTGSNKAGHPRRVLNNLFLHSAKLPAYLPPQENVVEDGNLYASLAGDGKAKALFQKYRASPAFELSKKLHAPGNSTNSRVGDPLFVRLDRPADLRLREGSPGLAAGVPLPEAWHDPLRPKTGAPDIGAYLHGAAPWHAGRPR